MGRQPLARPCPSRHGRGWHRPSVTTSVVAGMLARCSMLSSTTDLALFTAADAFRVMLHLAEYDWTP